VANLYVTSPAKRIPASELRTISRVDIEQAIHDFNAGAPHSFGESTDYDLIVEGKRYPPKAILGLAGKYALGRVLVPDDFSGGDESTCFRLLREYGFEIGPKEAPVVQFEVGKLYSRVKDIHERFSGQRMGGICTPTKVPAIFLFTGESGDQYGYVDQWNEDRSIYSFAGAGQEGDMAMKGGNRAIRDHAADGRALHLFEALGKGQPIRYMGQFDCMGHRKVPGIDKHDTSRTIFVFDLAPHTENRPTADPDLLDQMTRRLASKHWTLPPPGQTKPEKAPQSQGSAFKRDPEVRAYVLSLAGGSCELCAQPGPFRDSSGAWFLEVHHVVQLAKGGRDTVDNALALCPNCHRRLHHSCDATEMISLIYKTNPRIKP